MIRVEALLALATLVFVVPTTSRAQGMKTAETEMARLDGWGGFEGSIRSDLGQPLMGVLVSVFGASLRGGAMTALTDAYGHFRLPQLPPGIYVLHAYLAGFLPTRSAQIEVTENGVPPPLTLSMSTTLAAPPAPARAEDSKELSETGERIRELRWLVRHSRRNILRDQQPILVAEEAEAHQAAAVSLDAGVDMTGEVGVLAGEAGLGSVPGAGAGLDARLAYARLDIPQGPSSRWLVSAQLMESALSSWAARAEFVTRERVGQELRAGVTYGNYLYGSLDEFRPPEAGLKRRNEGDRTTEWFGSAYGRHRLKMGPMELETGLLYQHYSYLARANYVAPRVELAWSPSASTGTILRGSLNYTVNAPGGEDLGLLTRMVTADVAGLPVDTRHALRAERTLRYELEVEHALGNLGALEVRFFQENACDQLLKTYFRESSGRGPGGYLLANSGDFRTRGLGLSLSRRFGAVAGSVGYTYGRGRVLDAVAFEPGEEEEIHDLTTTVETAFDRTGTRVSAVYKLSSHFAGTDEMDRGALGSRFNVQVQQALPFLGWNHTEWEVLLAVRNLFYQDLAGASLLDEIFVVDSPRRVVGGVAVKF